MIRFTEKSQMNAKQLDSRLLAMCRKEKLGVVGGGGGRKGKK